MRGLALLWFSALANILVAQSDWVPLSRDVERPRATAIERWGSTMHTAIRPYRASDLRALDPGDTLRPAAALPALDRWAGRANGRHFRWGPLVDASLGYDATDGNGVFHRTGAGLWTDTDLLKNLNLHVAAQVWNEGLPGYLDTLVHATQVMPGEGYAYGDRSTPTHYDVTGHLSWDAGKYFNFTAGRGRNFFGDGHRSLMLSDEANSYPYLRITTTFWKIKYVNLFTAMSDIRGAQGVVGDMQRKYSSMHYLSWNASKRINVAVFEAIVWNAGDSVYPRGFDVNYLNPIIFYRPVEYNIGSPDNALLGFSFNVKAGRKVLFYSQLVLDELVVEQVRSGNGWYANKQSVQLGMVARDAFKVPGLSIRTEWNFVRPFMYTHSDTQQNYAHFGQPLAHPFGSNFQEAIVHVERDHGRWLHGLRTSMAWLGTDTDRSYGNNIFRPERERPRNADNTAWIDYGYRVGRIDTYSILHAELRSGWLVDPHTATRIEASYLFRLTTNVDRSTDLANVFRLGLVCHFRERHPEQAVRYVLN